MARRGGGRFRRDRDGAFARGAIAFGCTNAPRNDRIRRCTRFWIRGKSVARRACRGSSEADLPPRSDDHRSRPEPPSPARAGARGGCGAGADAPGARLAPERRRRNAIRCGSPGSGRVGVHVGGRTRPLPRPWATGRPSARRTRVSPESHVYTRCICKEHRPSRRAVGAARTARRPSSARRDRRTANAVGSATRASSHPRIPSPCTEAPVPYRSRRAGRGAPMHPRHRCGAVPAA